MFFLSILSFFVGVAGLLIRPMDIISPNANTIFSLIAILGSPLFLIKGLHDKKENEQYFQSEEYRSKTSDHSDDDDPYSDLSHKQKIRLVEEWHGRRDDDDD